MNLPELQREFNVRAEILIIDDSAVQIEHLCHSFPSKEFNITCCANGNEALDFLQYSSPDLVLCDIIMPGLDGYEICRYFQAYDRLKDIPIIMVTELSHFDRLEQAFAAGAMDYIVKPVQRVELLARVGSLLRLKRETDKRKRREAELLSLTNELLEKNQILERLSYIDGLTSIANRRYFDERFEKDWKNAVRDNSFLSLIFIDLDYFKTFNDKYGHQVGDECLKKVAVAVKNTLKRPYDFFARYGGEEFVAILSGTDIAGAVTVAEHMRQAVLDLNIPHDGSTIDNHVTISIGIATMQPKQTNESAELIVEADRALYDAKEGGRNQIRWKPQN